MKAMLVVLALVYSLCAFAGERIVTGVSYRQGNPEDCGSVAEPSRLEAEASADTFAIEACGGEGKPQRISDFRYSVTGCVWTGPRYRIPVRKLYAQATYNCVAPSTVRECRPFTFGCCGGRWCDRD